MDKLILDYMTLLLANLIVMEINSRWTKLLGSSNDDESWGITANDGSIYITGATEGNLNGKANNGGFDVFISKFNSDGNKEWTRLLGLLLMIPPL